MTFCFGMVSITLFVGQSEPRNDLPNGCNNDPASATWAGAQRLPGTGCESIAALPHRDGKNSAHIGCDPADDGGLFRREALSQELWRTC